jgi:hypothetical protein
MREVEGTQGSGIRRQASGIAAMARSHDPEFVLPVALAPWNPGSAVVAVYCTIR